MMVKILHNPKCSKSRECLTTLQDKLKDVQVINYLDGVLTEADILEIVTKLHCNPIDIIRTKDEFYIENYKNRLLSNDEWIVEMAKYPKLIERPIVINGSKAAVGRPLQNVLDIL